VWACRYQHASGLCWRCSLNSLRCCVVATLTRICCDTLWLRAAALAAPPSRAPGTLCASRSHQNAAAWWAALACVYIPVADAGARGGMGVFSADLGEDGCRDPAVIAFQARRDAEAAAWAWAAATQAPEGPQRCAPRPPYLARLHERAIVRLGAGRVHMLPPAELREAAATQGCRVVVFPEGQLPLRPGLSAEELASLFVLYGRDS